jgi:hypothetical protein
MGQGKIFFFFNISKKNRFGVFQVGGRSAGQVYYENLCMKAVNQSIGRAIRLELFFWNNYEPSSVLGSYVF